MIYKLDVQVVRIHRLNMLKESVMFYFWSPENGMLTSTLKMIRGTIEKHYQHQAEQLINTSKEKVIQI